jgi:hypothetical protein
MGVRHQLEVGVNEFVNKVLLAMMEAGAGEDSGLQPEQRSSALLVAGLLTAAKAAIVQAGVFVAEFELDDIPAPKRRENDLESS